MLKMIGLLTCIIGAAVFMFSPWLIGGHKERRYMLIPVMGIVLGLIGVNVWAHAKNVEIKSTPSMNIKACTPDGRSCTTASDIVRITPKADGSLYMELREGSWLTGVYTSAEQSVITIR